MALNSRQRKFADAYSGNAKEAAIAAGYSAKTAKAQGSRLLAQPEVAAAIRAREDVEGAATIANRRQRQEFWTQVMRDEKIDIALRLRASELLAKSEGDFLERHQLELGPSFAELVLAAMRPRGSSATTPEVAEA